MKVHMVSLLPFDLFALQQAQAACKGAHMHSLLIQSIARKCHCTLKSLLQLLLHEKCMQVPSLYMYCTFESFGL